MGKDTEFKENVKVQGFKDITKEIEPKKLYHPDKVFEKDTTVVVFESSSSGDRKTHIGEMIQFFSYIVPNTKWEKCYYVLYLCGEPDEKNEFDRLQSIYDSFPFSKNNREKIAAICIQDQPSNEELRGLTIEKIAKLNKLLL